MTRLTMTLSTATAALLGMALALTTACSPSIAAVPSAPKVLTELRTDLQAAARLDPGGWVKMRPGACVGSKRVVCTTLGTTWHLGVHKRFEKRPWSLDLWAVQFKTPTLATEWLHRANRAVDVPFGKAPMATWKCGPLVIATVGTFSGTTPHRLLNTAVEGALKKRSWCPAKNTGPAGSAANRGPAPDGRRTTLYWGTKSGTAAALHVALGSSEMTSADVNGVFFQLPSGRVARSQQLFRMGSAEEDSDAIEAQLTRRSGEFHTKVTTAGYRRGAELKTSADYVSGTLKVLSGPLKGAVVSAKSPNHRDGQVVVTVAGGKRSVTMRTGKLRLEECREDSLNMYKPFRRGNQWCHKLQPRVEQVWLSPNGTYVVAEVTTQEMGDHGNRHSAISIGKVL